MQHRFTLLEQRGDLGWLQAEHLALDVARQKERHPAAEQQGECRRRGKLWNVAGEPVLDAFDQDAD